MKILSQASRSFLCNWQLLLSACWLVTLTPGAAAPYPPEGLPTVWLQKNGTELKLLVFGDEFYGRTATPEGFTVVFDDESQTWFYAEKGADGETLVSTGVPADRKVPRGLVRNLSESSGRIGEKRRAMVEVYAPDRAAKWKDKVALANRKTGARAGNSELQAAPLAGTQAGLTILVQFPDDPLTAAADAVNFPATRSKMERWSNETGYTDDGNTGSVKDYFRDQSNGALTLTQVVSAVVTMPRPRSFYNYSDYPSNQTVRPDAGTAGRLLVTDAINKLKGDGFNFAGLSVDSSNRVLATSLLFAGPDSGNWAKGLWPHAWTLAGGINVGTAAAPRYIQRYQITNQANNTPVIGTFIHELGHLLLDYPDLYDTESSNGTSEGVGQHCLMGSGNFQNGGRTPAPINLYLKGVSGWANITDITPGTLLDAVLPSTGNVGYRIRKPGRPSEYFLFENRGTGDKWTNGAMDRGVVIWHVDELINGNDDQQMTSANHYEVSLEQADGRFDLENDNNRGDSGDFFDSSTPFFTNDSNPDADWWDGNASSIRAQITSAAGASINVKFGGTAPLNYLGVSPTTANLPSTGGSFSFSVNASGTWTWVRSGALITSGEAVQQTGIQNFNYAVSNNAGSVVRQHTITLTSGALSAVFTVVQAGVRIDDYGNNMGTATVLSQNGSLAGSLDYASDVDYFRVNVTGAGAMTMQTSGTTDTYGLLLNSGGQVLAQDDDSGADSNFRISYPVSTGVYYIAAQHFLNDQTGPYTITTSFSPGVTLSVNPTVRSVPGAGGVFDFTVDSNSTWSWTSNAAWLSAPEEPGNQNGPQSFTYAVAPQTSGGTRSAVITLTSGAGTSTHTINQAAPVADDHGNSTATATLIPPQSNTPGEIGVGGDEDFFKIVVPGSGHLTVKTTGNMDMEGFLMNGAGAELAYDDDDVDSNFLITWPVVAGTYYLKARAYAATETGNYAVVSALAAAPYLTLPSGSVSVPAAGAAQSVAVGSNAAWSWSISHPWVTAPGEAANQNNDQTFDYSVAPNALGVARSAVITFSPAGLGPVVLTITQPPAGPVISQQPMGVTVQPGVEATLTVATSSSAVNYQWYAGAPGNITIPVPEAMGGTLRIAPGATMSYWVRLTNASGSTDSNAAVVTVNTLMAGAIWTPVSSGTASALRSVIWSGTQFVAVGDLSGIRTSATGLSWQSRPVVPATQLESVAWSGSLLVAVGSGGTILSSPDGNVWTQRPSGITTAIQHITWTGSAFRAVADGMMLSSPDGFVWESQAGGAAGLLTMRALEGTLCATGGNQISVSPDGLTWTPRVTESGMTFHDVASNGVQWLVTDGAGRVRRSTNRGLTWSPAQIVSAGAALRATVSDGMGFVVAGQGGGIFTSADAVAWTARTSGTTQTLHSLAWNGTHLIAVGDGGVILRSSGARPNVSGAGYHAWAVSYGLIEGLAASPADADGDGQTNAAEFIHGTRPADASNSAVLNPEVYLDQGVMKIRLRYPYNPQANALNPLLQKSADGSAWNVLTPTVIPDGTGYTVRHEWNAPLTSTGLRSFFRFKYLVP